VPSKASLASAYADDPVMMNLLSPAGVLNTYMLGSSCAKQTGRQAALFQL
jgi:hypothetical protein